MEGSRVANTLEGFRSVTKPVYRQITHHLMLRGARSVWREDAHIVIGCACRNSESRHERSGRIARKAGVVLRHDEHAHAGKVASRVDSRRTTCRTTAFAGREHGRCELRTVGVSGSETIAQRLNEQEKDCR